MTTLCRCDKTSDPPTIKFSKFIKDTNGIPSVVWQQQMEKAYIKTFDILLCPDRYYNFDYTAAFVTQFRLSLLIEDYRPELL